ncbi:MAG: putative hydro-lyase [Phycisphaerae bacterium]
MNLQHPRDLRALCRRGEWTGPTAGLCGGFAQANLVIVPSAVADDFHEFCDRNRRACPLMERTACGSWEATRSAPGSDLRHDLPRYHVIQDGEITQTVHSIEPFWQQDFVSFLLGCSFTFEDRLIKAGVPVRHVECGMNVPMYRTTIPCESAGVFHGPLVVSMRPMLPAESVLATRISEAMPDAHGGPVHIGAPDAIGIRDIAKPDYGDAVPVKPGETYAFWACGVTPLEALRRARLPLAITHAPGHMFLSDLVID